jgi:hypothetical protein
MLPRAQLSEKKKVLAGKLAAVSVGTIAEEYSLSLRLPPPKKKSGGAPGGRAALLR